MHVSATNRQNRTGYNTLEIATYEFDKDMLLNHSLYIEVTRLTMVHFGGGDMAVNAARLRKRFLAWQKEMDALASKVGSIASDFELCDANGESTIRLSDFRGQKPVVLAWLTSRWYTQT